jgi:hypothetical protein
MSLTEKPKGILWDEAEPRNQLVQITAGIDTKKRIGQDEAYQL